jgi:hypothetical protein
MRKTYTFAPKKVMVQLVSNRRQRIGTVTEKEKRYNHPHLHVMKKIKTSEKSNRIVYFADAAHFVWGTFL